MGCLQIKWHEPIRLPTCVKNGWLQLQKTKNCPQFIVEQWATNLIYISPICCTLDTILCFLFYSLSPMPNFVSLDSLTRHKFICTVWAKQYPPEVIWFFSFFSQTVKNFNQFFTHLLCVPIYARLQIFIQLSPTLTKLCHIKCDYRIHIMCEKCPSAEMRACRCLWKSLIALLIVVCGKSSQICCFYNVNKHVGNDMTSTVTSFAQ